LIELLLVTELQCFTGFSPIIGWSFFILGGF